MGITDANPDDGMRILVGLGLFAFAGLCFLIAIVAEYFPEQIKKRKGLLVALIGLLISLYAFSRAVSH